MKNKLNIILRFLLGMFIAFVLATTIGFFSTLQDCRNGVCYVKVCEEEGPSITDDRTGQSGNVCVSYGTARYPAKDYLFKESIIYGFFGALGLGLFLGGIFVDRYRDKKST